MGLTDGFVVFGEIPDTFFVASAVFCLGFISFFLTCCCVYSCSFGVVAASHLMWLVTYALHEGRQSECLVVRIRTISPTMN